MSIDYYGQFPCEVRRKVSSADLLRMEKAANRAITVRDLMRQEPAAMAGIPESEWTFKAVVMGPSGPQESTVRIADLLAEAAPLADLSSACKGCPHNVHKRNFGCGGAIRYPISANAEAWLLSRLPSDLKSPAAALLMRAIDDFGYDGADIDRARSRKELYELDRPLQRKWGGLFTRKATVTSSQILQMAFGLGSLQPAHAKMVAYFAGYVDDQFQAMTSAAELPAPEDDTIVAEMKLFLLVAARAGTSNTGVYIDA